MSGSVIKVSYDGDFRRFRHPAEAGLGDLRAKIASLYPEPLGPGAQWRLLYTDEDGDRITIAQDDDLALARETAGGAVLRLQIRLDAPAGSVRHACHGHTLALSSSATPWICDGGDRPGGCRNGENHGDPRYRCTQGCDFDLCQACIDDPTPGIEQNPGAQGRGPFRSGNFHNLIHNLRTTLGEHGVECSVDLGACPVAGSHGGCPVAGMGMGMGMGRGCGRGRGRRGRRGGCHRSHFADAGAAPETDGQTAAAAATADTTPAPATTTTTASAPTTNAPPPATAPLPDVPASPAAAGPWAAEVQLLQDMGLRADPAALRASLDRHNGAIGAVLSELLSSN